jgi:hypothetical protein
MTVSAGQAITRRKLERFADALDDRRPMSLHRSPRLHS